jgi:hypothetical protein
MKLLNILKEIQVKNVSPRGTGRPRKDYTIIRAILTGNKDHPLFDLDIDRWTGYGFKSALAGFFFNYFYAYLDLGSVADAEQYLDDVAGSQDHYKDHLGVATWYIDGILYIVAPGNLNEVQAKEVILKLIDYFPNK